MLLSDSSCKIKEVGQLKYLVFLFKPNPSIQSQHHLWSSSPETGWQKTKCWVKSPCKTCKESVWELWMDQATRTVSEHCHTWSGRGPEGWRAQLSAGNHCLAMCVMLHSYLYMAPNWPARQPWAVENLLQIMDRVRDKGAWGRRAYPIPCYVQSSQWVGLAWTPSTKMHAKDRGQEKRWHLSTKQPRMPTPSFSESHIDPFLEGWENHDVLSVCVRMYVCGDEV